MRSSKSIGQTEPERFFISKYLDGSIDVTKDGRVYNNRTGRYIGAVGSGGYPKISMARLGRRDIVNIQIHRLVWLIYRGDIPQDLEINHKDGVKCNSSLDNLELMTRGGNMKHAIDAGLSSDQKCHNNHNSKFNKDQIYAIRSRVYNGERMVDIAKEFGVHRTTIKYIIDGVTYNYSD